MLRAPYLLAAVLCVAAACGGDDGASPDARDVDAATIDSGSPDATPMPETLFDTGLCVDAACTQIDPSAREYAPEYALFSDGAAKRRWIYLPEGAQIDTSDMDHWQFPVGTKLWKEFAVVVGDTTTKLETRLLMKIGPEPLDWYRATYAWNEAQDATTLADPSFGAEDVLGTTHDIPSRSDCRKCHDNLDGGVLGFQAILMDHDGPGVTLDDLVTEGLLTSPPTRGDDGEYFPVPGGGGPAQAALGYLHVNCGNCHNPESPVINNAPVVWRLDVATLRGDITQTPPYQTAVGVDALIAIDGVTKIIDPDDDTPDGSVAYLRMNTTSDIKMPKLGRETIDTDGVAAVAAWINSL